MTGWPRREDMALAAALALFAGAWLLPWWPVALAAAASTAAAVVVRRAHPLGAVALVWAVQASVTLVGVPAENPALLPVAIVVLYGLGRRGSLRAGAVGLAATVPAVVLADPGSPVTMVFATVVVTTAWGFGRVVRRRVLAALHAERLAADLAARDPRAHAALVVAEERARVAASAVDVVREAVASMLSDARHARDHDVDAASLERVRSKGGAAVGELRLLLGLLRDEPSEASRAPRRQRPVSIRHAWLGSAAVTALLTVAALVDIVNAAGAAPVGQVVATLLLTLAEPLRRRNVPLACFWVACWLVVGGLLDGPLEYGVTAVAVTALLAWVVGGHGTPAAWVCLAALTIVAALVNAATDVGNVPITLVLIALPAVAGRAWTESSRVESAARQTGERRRALLDTAAADAVRAERLRIARELHDVTSHAVGVMTLHAAAATAQRDRDPRRALASLDVLCQVGEAAIGDLDRLAQVLATDSPADEHADLAISIPRLADRIRGAGQDVQVSLPGVVDEPVIRSVIYRLVQEALTNAVRHAPGANIRVTVQDAGAGVRVEVVDDGSFGVPADPARPGAGFGLTGLDERVRAVGGTLAAGPLPEGGYRVTAHLPARRVVS